MIASEISDWPGRQYDTRNRPRRRGRREHRERSSTARFIAWDGEGYSTSDGDHHYMLFGNSDGDSVRGKDLSWRECFPLLLETGQDGINVVYGGHYDIVMMTKTMPFVVRDRLYKGQPVKYGGYRMVYYRSKYLLLKHYKSGLSTALYDVMTFFQCSFVNACREYLGNDDTLDAMHAMKLKRDSFTYGDETVDPYWRSELVYLVRLMDTLRELFAAVNIRPNRWYGPGAVASAVLKREEVDKHYGITPPEVIDIAERAYYGGRFEHFKVGRIDQIYEYDIRSAYPAAISVLPSFKNVEWEFLENPQGIRPFGLYKVSWDIPFRPWTLGPFPWRDDKGNILFPLKGSESWYWGIEVKELVKRYRRNCYTIHSAYEPKFPRNVEYPFGFVESMYNDRARMKREGNPAQRALKLGLNSLYGKLAQSTGARRDDDGIWTKPRWHHILWAGWITAYTRAKLLGAIGGNQRDIVALETDAVFSTKELALPIGDRLGTFESTTIERVLYIHSGVYYALNDGAWKLKSRGIEADSSRTADYWLDIFAQLPETPQYVTLKVRRFGTDIRQPGRFGRWFEHEATTCIPGTKSKRMHNARACPSCRFQKGSYADTAHYLVVPQTIIESDWQSSTPYNFPWREDVKYNWHDVRGEFIDDLEGLEWSEV